MTIHDKLFYEMRQDANERHRFAWKVYLLQHYILLMNNGSGQQLIQRRFKTTKVERVQLSGCQKLKKNYDKTYKCRLFPAFGFILVTRKMRNKKVIFLFSYDFNLF